MIDDAFSVEEGAALLHAIFPNYPDTQEMLPAPNIRVSCGLCEPKNSGEPASSAVLTTRRSAKNI